uniref:DNA-directed RNA polymerase III subunit RPC4 n=1 Tax=Steinernema glaseri TaxID=37863 RepID=A0A1I7Y705_9BILA
MSDANDNQENPPPAANDSMKTRFRKLGRDIELSFRSRKVRRVKNVEAPTQSVDGTTTETQKTVTQQSAEILGPRSTKTSAEGGAGGRQLLKKWKDRAKQQKVDRGEKNMRDSIRQSFKSFKERRAKNLKQVKTFISRPYKTASMQKILNRVTSRKELRAKYDVTEISEESEKPSIRLKEGDDLFPTLRKAKSAPATPSAPTAPAIQASAPTPEAPPPKQSSPPRSVAPPKEKPPEKASTPQKTLADDIKEKLFKQTPKRQIRLVKNNDNNGQLFNSDGMPFWHQKGKGIRGRDDIDASDLTDDELPMNAEILLDVHSGKLKLVDLPNTEVVLDPFASLQVLEARDELFFTRNVLFSNTVRSMINLNDDMTSSELRKKSVIPRK